MHVKKKDVLEKQEAGSHILWEGYFEILGKVEFLIKHSVCGIDILDTHIHTNKCISNFASARCT